MAQKSALGVHCMCVFAINMHSFMVSLLLAVPTFVSFLKEVESPYEVHDYIRAYLGDTPEAKEFAKQFLERRAKQKASQQRQQQQQQVRVARLSWGWDELENQHPCCIHQHPAKCRQSSFLVLTTKSSFPCNLTVKGSCRSDGDLGNAVGR